MLLRNESMFMFVCFSKS